MTHHSARKLQTQNVIGLVATVIVLAVLSSAQSKDGIAGSQPSASPFFLPAIGYPSGGLFPGAVVVGDVNGDGRPDIVLVNSSSLGVLLGHGDGTFDDAATYSSGGYTFGLALADVNGDGKLDIIATNCGPPRGWVRWRH